MTEEFPAELVGLLRCRDDHGPLTPGRSASDPASCPACGRTYSTRGGILRLGVEGLHPESDRERRIRDREAVDRRGDADETPGDRMEIDATLEALDPRRDHRILELGAGRGRFTRLLARLCSRVVALDISLESLRANAERLETGTVGLVHADATEAITAPRAFDRVLGTLASNLPTREARQASYGAAAAALVDDGRFVFSTHYYGIRAWAGREPREGRYREGEGIYRCLLRPSEVREELQPYFRRIRVRPICVVLPLSGRLGVPLVQVDRLARRVPIVRAWGDLLLAEATDPRR